jgi:hypothetical protein
LERAGQHALHDDGVHVSHCCQQRLPLGVPLQVLPAANWTISQLINQ